MYYSTIEKQKTKQVRGDKHMEIILREAPTNDWITIVLFICTATLAAAKLMNATLFADFIMLFNSNKYLAFYHKENKLSSFFNSLLVLVQILSVSLFIYITADTFRFEDIAVDQLLFFKIAGFYAVLLLFKIFVEKIIAAIFSIESVIEHYLFYKISYRNFLGLLLLPLNFFFIYTAKPSQTAISILLILIIILNVFILAAIYKKNENIILSHLFYFILYLCTLEIAPYFILYKVIM